MHRSSCIASALSVHAHKKYPPVSGGYLLSVVVAIVTVSVIFQNTSVVRVDLIFVFCSADAELNIIIQYSVVSVEFEFFHADLARFYASMFEGNLFCFFSGDDVFLVLLSVMTSMVMSVIIGVYGFVEAYKAHRQNSRSNYHV